MKKGQYVLVTTAHRGVFAGKLVVVEEKTITLEEARNCIYWSPDTGGFLGLAAIGPTAACRIGDTAPMVKLFDVTSVSECSKASADAWKSAKVYGR